MSCVHCLHCFPPKFRKGSTVRLKNPQKGMTRGVGWIHSHVRPNQKSVYVVWKHAFSGRIKLDQLELVPPGSPT